MIDYSNVDLYLESAIYNEHIAAMIDNDDNQVANSLSTSMFTVIINDKSHLIVLIRIYQDVSVQSCRLQVIQ